MSSDNVFDDNDIRFYDDFLNCQPDEDELTREWGNEINNDLSFGTSSLDLMPDDDLGAIVHDLDLKCSPESSDSGNHSPGSSDCFNSSDSWILNNLSYQNNNNNNDTPKVVTNFKQCFQHKSEGNYNPNNVNNNNPPVSITSPVNLNHASPPTYYTAPIANSSKTTVVVAQPLETITLVPARLTSTAQAFVVSSTPTMKFTPLPKPASHVLPPLFATPNPPKSEPQSSASDEYRKKIEDRRVRNRAAAQASRNRKRMQMDTMKEKLAECEAQCLSLRIENENLKRRLMELEDQNEMLAHSDNGSTLKHKKAKTLTGVCLMVCALVFTLAGPLRSSPSYSTDLQVSNAIAIKDSPEYNFLRRHGRSLAEVHDYDVMSDAHESLTNNNNTIKICPPTFLNVTEKIRLNNDINSWIDRHTQMNLVELRQGINPFLIHNSAKNKLASEQQHYLNSAEIVKSAIEDRRNLRLSKRNSKEKKKFSRDLKFSRQIRRVIGPIKLEESKFGFNSPYNRGYELAIRSELESRLMEELATAIKQQEDVLYVVTMKDYFLMPMIQRNATSAPKLSIVIPALRTTNASNPQIQMLQIDCIVSSTRNFYLSDSLVSLFNRSNNQ